MSERAIDKFKIDKKHRFFILSGEQGLGKTKAAIERAVFLKDNYCLRNNENILFIGDNSINSFMEQVKARTNRLNTLFSLLDNEIEIFSKKNFFHKCYESININNQRFCDNDIVKGIILEGIGKVRQENKRIDKIILPQNIDFLYDEILYMKELNISSKEEYQVLDRKKRGRALRKNSKVRMDIYELYQWYCTYMKELLLIDYIDEFKAIDRLKDEISLMKYAHIIIDNSEEFTLKELQFIRSFLKEIDYSNFILIKNNGIQQEMPWINTFKRNKDVAFFDNNKYKTIRIKSEDNTIEAIKTKEELGKLKEEPLREKNIFIENYKYIDLKHNYSHAFAIDTSTYDEVILNPDTTSEIIGKDEISKVPVYNEIAAGEPISINDEFEGNFNLPIYWLKGIQQPFILKIKGDSMINIDIQDGDYVVINKQTMANHNDIVAVSIDGEATLKRLWLKNGKAVLMPENDKYYPIEIKEDNAYIIGKAVGLIKALS